MRETAFLIVLSILSTDSLLGQGMTTHRNDAGQMEVVIEIEKCEDSEAGGNILLGMESRTFTESGNGRKLKRQGCCSRHKGVCGCKEGKVVCCDETLSPSCKCGD